MSIMVIFWVIVIVGFLVVEVLAPTFVAISFSIAGIVGLIMEFLGFGLLAQLIGYSIALALTLYFLLPILKRIANSKSSSEDPLIKTNLDVIIGAVGEVHEEISLTNDGMVKVGGKDWTAKVLDDIVIEVGELVVVKQISGSKIIVEKKDKGEN